MRVAHKRIRVVNGRVQEAPLTYSGAYSSSNGYTDVRIVTGANDADFVYERGKTVDAVAADYVKAHSGSYVAINGPYVDKPSGTIIGKTIVDGKVLFEDVAKTTQRQHFYVKDGKFGIGRIDDPTGVKFAVQASPRLLDGGNDVVDASIECDQLAPDIAIGVNPRTAVGLRPDGTLVIVVVDGRGSGDRGLTLHELASVFVWLKCTDAINLDGGSSSVLCANNDVLSATGDLKGVFSGLKTHIAQDGQTTVADLSHALVFSVDYAEYDGIDCASHISTSESSVLASNGINFVGRYYAPSDAAYDWKRLTLDEAKALSLRIVPIFEGAPGRPKGGANNGLEDGDIALKVAKSFNQPINVPVTFTCDFQALASDMDAIEAYLKAAKSVLGGYPIGVYGSYAVIEEMARRGAADFYMQTVAWSDGLISIFADVYQRVTDQAHYGLNVDLDVAYGQEVGFVMTQYNVQGEVHVIVDGKDANNGLLINDTTYVPIRVVAETLGAQVDWDGKTQTVTITKG